MDIYSSFGIIDLIVIGAGFYGFYSWYLLVKKHEIKKTFLVGGTLTPEQCSDVEGFADHMGRKLLVLSVAMLLFGSLSAYNSYIAEVGMILWIGMAVFLAVIVWYCLQLRKAEKLYFQQQKRSVKDRALNK